MIVAFSGHLHFYFGLYSRSILYYRIRPNYRTVRLDFSKILGHFVVKYVPTYTKHAKGKS